jgi:proline iminopeptidase
MLGRTIIVSFLFLALSMPAVARSSDDLFSRLQQNVWYLQTGDKAARLYVTEIGQGAPVVFLHGGPGNDFNYIIDALRPHLGRHRFILFDQRGSLLSPVAAEQVKTLSLAVLVDDLETLRQALGEDKLVLFGHSFGTLLAEAYFEKYPEHVAGMVLAASMPAQTPEGGFAALLKAMRPRQNALRDRPLVLETLAAEGFPTDPADDTPRQHSDRWRLTNLAAGNLVRLDRWRSIQGGDVYYSEAVDSAIGDTIPGAIDLGPTLNRHPIPITVIDGDQDYLDPSAGGWRAQAKRSPRITLRTVPEAGHYAWIDNPSVFARDLEIGLRTADSRK